MTDPETTEQRPLHILEMGTNFGMGGIARHILGLRDWLRIQGHHVTLAGTPDVWGGPEQDPEFIPLPTRYVAAGNSGLPTRLLQTVRATRILRHWLATHKVDVIHCHESAPALVANLARGRRNIPIAITYHGSEPERIASFGRIARRCDLVITPSHRSADDLHRIGGVPKDRLQVIGLGIKPMPPHNEEDVAQLRARLLGDGNRLIITLARLTHQKGIDILIDCVARMKQDHPDYRFVVAGNGPDDEKLQNLARDKGVESHLTFVGRTETPHLYLKAADLFLLTSRWEALPFTIAEAFQAGTPAVAAACAGVVELIDDEVGGVVPIGDIDAVCAKVVDILSDEPRRRAMAAAALARSREDRFRPDYVHEQFENVYQQLAGRG